MKRHLHRDYSTAFCGRDASHILMTYKKKKEATCTACLNAEKANAPAKA